MNIRTILSLLVLFSVTTVARAQVVVTPTMPYFENFEAGPGAWTANNVWQRGLPTKPGFNLVPSGTNVFITGLAANYPNNADARLTAVFDFTALDTAPVIRFKLRVEAEENFDGLRLEVNDGSGFRQVGEIQNEELRWYEDFDDFGLAWTLDSGTYLDRAYRLDGTAGKVVTLRFRFRSDSSVTDRGVAIDDIQITADLVPVVVTDAVAHTDDFESGPGNLVTLGTTWEHGVPTSGQLAASGMNAWATVLAGNYPGDTVASLDIAVDGTGLTRNAVISFALDNVTEETFDGLAVFIDLGDGFGLVGAIGQGIEWYNETALALDDTDSFSGDFGGFIRPQIELPGTAGQRFTIRFVFGADDFLQLDGVLIDDLTIESSSPLPGTNEDLVLCSSIDFATLRGGSMSTDTLDVQAGDFVSVRLLTPLGTAAGLQYVLFASPVASSNPVVPEVTFPPALVAMFPALSPSRLYANLMGPDQSIIILGNGDLGLGFPVVMPFLGVGFTFQWPPSFSGRGVQFQAAVMDPNAANGMYRSTNAQLFID